MLRLSIVIPWVGPAEPFEATLAAVLQNRPSGCEVLVPLSAPYDDPYELAGEVEFLPAAGGRESLTALANRGMQAAQAPVVQFLGCGQTVTDGWTSAALLHFDDPEVGAVAPALVAQQHPERVLCAGIDFQGGARRICQSGRRWNVAELVQTRPLGAPLTGGFFRRDALEALGGFDETLSDMMADTDMALALASLGFRTECEPTSVIASLPQGASDGSFASGRSAERICGRYREEARVGSGRALRLAGELARCLVQPKWLAHAAGRAIGKLQASFERSHAARLAAAREALAQEPSLLKLPTRGTTVHGSTHRRAA